MRTTLAIALLLIASTSALTVHQRDGGNNAGGNGNGNAYGLALNGRTNAEGKTEHVTDKIKGPKNEVEEAFMESNGDEDVKPEGENWNNKLNHEGRGKGKQSLVQVKKRKTEKSNNAGGNGNGNAYGLALNGRTNDEGETEHVSDVVKAPKNDVENEFMENDGEEDVKPEGHWDNRNNNEDRGQGKKALVQVKRRLAQKK